MKTYYPVGSGISNPTTGFKLPHAFNPDVYSTNSAVLFVQCAGNSAASAADPGGPGSEGGLVFDKIVVIASYVDSSNFALLLPGGGGVGESEIEVWAEGTAFAAPSSTFISVFCRAPMNEFANGVSSIQIPIGTGKIFKVISYNPTSSPFPNNNVWAAR